MSVKVTWYGHATIGVETGGYQVLIDPYFSENPAAAVKAEEVKPDFILVSHGHFDHVGDAEAIAKRTGALLIANVEIASWFSNKGVEKTHGQQIGGGFHHPFGYLKLTQAFHGSKLPDGSYGGMPAGFLLTTTEGPRLYFACDTGLFGDMALYGDEGIDLAMVPIGDNFTMGPDDALRAVKLLRPRHVVPIHYDTWGPIEQDADAWAERVKAETKSEVHVIKPGGSLEV